MRTEMSAALPYQNALDGCSAVWAGVSSALVNIEIILKIASAIHPINARPLTFNTSDQHLPDTRQQFL